MAKIGVIGTGYVGLVTAVGFSELGHDVLGMDIDEEKISLLKKGASPIDEAGLEPVLRKNLEKGKLRFTTSIEETMRFSDDIRNSMTVRIIRRLIKEGPEGSRCGLPIPGGVRLPENARHTYRF